MAFDPVRDAILNSPERTSYADPFEDENDEAHHMNHDHGHGREAGARDLPSFKAPERISTSHNFEDVYSPGTRSSYGAPETPGGLTVPPTPGSSTIGGNGSIIGEDGRIGSAGGLPNRRQSSIFSLLSPEPPNEDDGNGSRPGSRNNNGYFDKIGRAHV